MFKTDINMMIEDDIIDRIERTSAVKYWYKNTVKSINIIDFEKNYGKIENDVPIIAIRHYLEDFSSYFQTLYKRPVLYIFGIEHMKDFKIVLATEEDLFHVSSDICKNIEKYVTFKNKDDYDLCLDYIYVQNYSKCDKILNYIKI